MVLKPARLIVGLLLANGATALMVSLYLNSSVLAIIGLGLMFWGSLLLYIEPKQYVQIGVLNSTSRSLLELSDQILSSLDYRGKAIYLPSQYFPEPNNERVFINRGDDNFIPPVEAVTDDGVLVDEPPGLLVIPPGLALANLYEEELGRRFADIQLDRLEERLVKLFTEDLGIAKDLGIDMLGDTIFVKLTEHIFRDMCLKASSGCGSLSCPLCSSLALAFSRAANQPVTIENIRIEPNGDLEVLFKKWVIQEPPDLR